MSFNSTPQLFTMIEASRFVCSSNSSAAVWPVRSFNSKSEPSSIPSNTTLGTTFTTSISLVPALNPNEAIKALKTTPLDPLNTFLFFPHSWKLVPLRHLH